MVAPNCIYRLSVVGTVHGQAHIHTLHFRSTAVTAVSTATEGQYQQALIDDWQANARTEYRAMFYTGDLVCQTYQVRKVCGSLPLPGGIDETEAGGTSAGTRPNPNSQLPSWLAGVVTVRTGFQGRSYRGRSFFGGLDEQDQHNGVLQAGWLALATAYYEKLKTTYMDVSDATASYKMFVFSRKLANGDPNADPPVPPVACQLAGADAESFVVRSAVASMKSRKPGSGG